MGHFFVAFGGHCRGIEKRVKIGKKKEKIEKVENVLHTYCTVGKGDLFPYSIENQTFWTCKIVCFLSYCDLP